MADDKQERRSGQRTPVRVPVSVKTTGGSIEATGVTRDLSDGGVFLYTDSQISEGSQLEMVLILPPEITQERKAVGLLPGFGGSSRGRPAGRKFWCGRKHPQHGRPAGNTKLKH